MTVLQDDTTPSTSQSHREPRHRRLKASLLIGLCSFLIYNANGRAISAGDTYPARYLPFAILQYHTLLLNPIENIAGQGRGNSAYWLLRRPDGRLISLYPIVVPVLIAPLYVPAVAYLHVRGWTGARLDYVAHTMEKLTASLLSALSVSLMFLLLRRRASTKTAMLLTIAFAFGTTTWVVSSQALWQHGMGQLLIIALLLFLTSPANTRNALAAGLLCGLVASNRPPDLILAAVLGLFALSWAGSRRWVLFVSAAALPMALVLLYNLRYAGNFAGGYGAAGSPSFFQHNLLVGIAGLLVSPTKGLFVFSPFLLFLCVAWRYLPRVGDERKLTLLMTLGVVIQTLLYAKSDWRGGLSWGPRYMTDLLPLLIWMLVPVVENLRGAARWCFHVAVAVAVGIEAIGAFCYFGMYDAPIFAADVAGTNNMRPAFQRQNMPFDTSLQNGIAPRQLGIEPRGSFEAIEAGGQRTSSITAGESAFASGWALAGDAAPFRVGVSINGGGTFTTTTFAPRGDIVDAHRKATLAGWRVPLDTSRLAPGEHKVIALVWPFKHEQPQYLDERTLIVRSAQAVPVATPAGVRRKATETTELNDLREEFRTAAARVREHQQPDGYWLTSFTSGAQFQQPRSEMNTFLTSLVVDLLDPLSASAGLEETLRRARHHLTSQIEPGGLVRYHGRTNGPWIGTLGCAITPDTDDTALVWRIAPAADRSQLTAALATIEHYRTAEGLYRTWLAPRAEYQCLDPGRDPNPADVAIQMHLLQLLSKERPAEGRALCDALRRNLDNDRIWVYYKGMPVVPILRSGDLHRAGCDLRLPAARMRTEVAGQAIWISIAQWLVPPKGSTPDRAAIGAALRDLARDDFALLRTAPPLLYHNDFTATVARYYWSEDVGYALWLRLYDKYEEGRKRAG